MTLNNDKFNMLAHAREIYQTHLHERWNLIHFMLIVYPAIFGGIGYAILSYSQFGPGYSIAFNFLLFCSFLLLMLITFFFKSLSDRLGHLIRIQRDNVIKEIENDLDLAKEKEDEKDKDPGCYKPITREGYLDKNESRASTTATGMTLKWLFNILFTISIAGILISISPVRCFLLRAFFFLLQYRVYYP